MTIRVGYVDHSAAGDSGVTTTAASPDRSVLDPAAELGTIGVGESETEDRSSRWVVGGLIVAVCLWVFVMALGFAGSVLLALALVGFFVTLTAGTMFLLSRL